MGTGVQEVRSSVFCLEVKKWRNKHADGRGKGQGRVHPCPLLTRFSSSMITAAQSYDSSFASQQEPPPVGKEMLDFNTEDEGWFPCKIIEEAGGTKSQGKHLPKDATIVRIRMEHTGNDALGRNGVRPTGTREVAI